MTMLSNFDDNTKPLDKPITTEEEHVISIMYGEGKQPGRFVGSLINAIAHADENNARKLRTVYPEYVNAVLSYQYGNLWERWISQHPKQKER